jgi:hypothetical protein
MRRVHKKRARTCAACTTQLAHGMRARMQPDGRHDTRTTTRHSFAPGNGNEITHLQDHVVVDSKIFNAQLHVRSCDVSGGADLVSQLLHSLFVGAVEVFSVGRKIRPVRAVKQVKSGGSVIAPMLGALGLPPSVDLRPRADGCTDASQGSHDDVHCLQACAQARFWQQWAAVGRQRCMRLPSPAG